MPTERGEVAAAVLDNRIYVEVPTAVRPLTTRCMTPQGTHGTHARLSRGAGTTYARPRLAGRCTASAASIRQPATDPSTRPMPTIQPLTCGRRRRLCRHPEAPWPAWGPGTRFTPSAASDPLVTPA
jgi:hypothetical protein